MFRCQSNRHHGFTLIEVLVVMVVIGVAVAMIAVNLTPDPRQVLGGEAQRLALLLQQARDEAMTTGSAIAFSVDEHGYRFWQRGPASPMPSGLPVDEKWPGRGWTAHADNEVFRPRQLPPAITIGALRLNGQPAAAEARRIVFPSSGMAQPFRLSLGSGGLQMAVAGDAMGNIGVE